MTDHMWYIGQWETYGIRRVEVVQSFWDDYLEHECASILIPGPSGANTCRCEEIGETVFQIRGQAVEKVLTAIVYKLEALERQKSRLIMMQRRLS